MLIVLLEKKEKQTNKKKPKTNKWLWSSWINKRAFFFFSYTFCVCPVWAEAPLVQTWSRSQTEPESGTNQKAWILPQKISAPGGRDK